LCLDNRGYPASLEIGKVYRVMPSGSGAPSGWMRIVDESGEDYLYPGQRFVEIELPSRAKRVLAAR
jgi:hypothetical protein